MVERLLVDHVVGVGILLVNLWLDKRAAENAAAEAEQAGATTE